MAEVEAPAVTADPPAAEAPVEAAKPVKEKKARALREKKPREAKSAPSHPPYFEMIQEAITALQEKSGSSAYAIAKYMESKHKAVLPENYKKKLALQLKNAAAKGKLIKIKASFKLAEAAKKKPATDLAKKQTKPAAAKPKAKKTTKKASITAAKQAKKPATKKAPKKKAAAPKPKSIKSAKSPAPKRAKKAA